MSSGTLPPIFVSTAEKVVLLCRMTCSNGYEYSDCHSTGPPNISRLHLLTGVAFTGGNCLKSPHITLCNSPEILVVYCRYLLETRIDLILPCNGEMSLRLHINFSTLLKICSCAPFDDVCDHTKISRRLFVLKFFIVLDLGESAWT